jgi:hypothetical protein
MASPVSSACLSWELPLRNRRVHSTGWVTLTFLRAPFVDSLRRLCLFDKEEGSTSMGLLIVDFYQDGSILRAQRTATDGRIALTWAVCLRAYSTSKAAIEKGFRHRIERLDGKYIEKLSPVLITTDRFFQLHTIVTIERMSFSVIGPKGTLFCPLYDHMLNGLAPRWLCVRKNFPIPMRLYSLFLLPVGLRIRQLDESRKSPKQGN